MQKATVIFHRQVIRLCKGAIKAWEQWVDDMELEAINNVSNAAQLKIPEEKYKNDRSIKIQIPLLFARSPHSRATCASWFPASDSGPNNWLGQSADTMARVFSMHRTKQIRFFRKVKDCLRVNVPGKMI